MRFNRNIKSKLYKYFKYRLDLKPSTKGFIRGNCPYCGSKFTFGVNIERLKVNCFKNCGVPKHPITLLMHLEEFETRNEAYDFLKVQQEYEFYDSIVKREKVLAKREVELPESYTLINLGDSILSRIARNYLKGRGYNIDKLAMQGVGYCTSGQYEGYIIFPFYEQGKLVFFQGRRFAGNGPKMQNPAEEDFGIGKTQLIFNKDALFIYRRIFIMESITNTLTLGDRGIGLLGKKPSTSQISTIIKSPCEELIILLDPDALPEAIKLAMILCQYKKVKLIYWEGNKDVNDLGKKNIMEKIKQFDFLGYSDYFNLSKNLKGNEETGFTTHNGKPVTKYLEKGAARIGRRQLL